MESITIRVVNDEDEPIEGKRVRIFLTHWVMPQTWLDEFTDDEGRADFEFEDCLSVDVYVDGDLQLEGVNDDGGEVTVCI